MKVRGKRVSAEIPTASQSDIAFLLIIFFLITTSFAVKTGIPLEYPKKDAAKKEVLSSELGTIQIGKARYTVGGKTVGEKNLSAVIAAYPFSRILVTVERGTAYSRVTRVLSLVERKKAHVSIRLEEGGGT